MPLAPSNRAPVRVKVPLTVTSCSTAPGKLANEKSPLKELQRRSALLNFVRAPATLWSLERMAFTS